MNKIRTEKGTRSRVAGKQISASKFRKAAQKLRSMASGTQYTVPEERLCESVAHTLLNIPYTVSILISTDGVCLDVSDNLAQRFGKVRSDFIGKPIWDFLPPDVAAQRKFYVDQAVKTKKTVRFEDERLGTWNDSIVSPILDDRGNVLEVAVIAIDITERKRVEEALKEREKRLDAIFNHQLVGMVITSPERGWLEANDTWCRMIGYSREELAALDWALLTHPDDLSAEMVHFKRILSGEINQYTLQKRFICKDGAVLHTEISVGCVRRSDGIPEYIVGLATDITERKRTEEKLQESETELAQAQRVAHLGNWRFNRITKEVRWSEELYRIFEIGKKEFDGVYDAFLACIHPDDKQRVLEIHKKAIDSGTSYEVEYRIVTRQGNLKHIRGIGHPVKDAAGTVVGLFGVSQDITEQKLSEEERIRKKSEERIMANLLMEIHDGIGGITSNIALLAELALRQPMQEELKQKVALISELSRDGMAEIRSLMYGLDKEDLNWHAIAGELKKQSAKLLGPHGIAFNMTTDFENSIPDPSNYVCLQLFRIYREAIINIIKHAKAKKVTVNLRVLHDDLFLEIYDNGKGINKSPRSVTGRGIGNMMRRAEALGGKTTISGNAGTRVTVEIPLQLQSSNG